MVGSPDLRGHGLKQIHQLPLVHCPWEMLGLKQHGNIMENHGKSRL